MEGSDQAAPTSLLEAANLAFLLHPSMDLPSLTSLVVASALFLKYG